MKVRFELTHPEARIPFKATPGSAGFDLFMVESLFIPMGSWKMISLGFRVEIPSGYVGSLRPRSSLFSKTGLTIPNSPGTIDSDYRGEIHVILKSGRVGGSIIKKGDRVAQLLISQVCDVEWCEAQKGTLTTTERGCGGFGSTGR